MTQVLVLGATGGQGGAVADALLARGQGVRALVRDPRDERAERLADRGVELVAGSLEDTAALTAAMSGMDAAFAVTTPFEDGPDAEVRQGRAIVAAARQAGLAHLVLSSVADATHHTGVPHFDSKAQVEADLAASGVPHTIVGPTYFFDNALGGLDRIREGVLELPLPGDRPLQQLARADLGEFVATVLQHPTAYGDQRIDLASDAPTPEQMASALGAALGREVRHERVPLPTPEHPDMHAMWSFLNGPGYSVDLPALHANHPDVGWTTFGEWAAGALG